MNRHGLKLTDEMRFLKAFQAMEMNTSQKIALMDGMQNSINRNDPALLKAISVRFLTIGDEHTTQFLQENADYEETIAMNNDPFKKSNRPGHELTAIQGVRNLLVTATTR